MRDLLSTSPYLNCLVQQRRPARRRRHPKCCPRPERQGQRCWDSGTDGTHPSYSPPLSPSATVFRIPGPSLAPWSSFQGGVGKGKRQTRWRSCRGEEGEVTHTHTHPEKQWGFRGSPQLYLTIVSTALQQPHGKKSDFTAMTQIKVCLISIFWYHLEAKIQF